MNNSARYQFVIARYGFVMFFPEFPKEVCYSIVSGKNWITQEDARSCCIWWKGMSQDKVVKSGEEIKSVILSIVEFCLVKGIS